MSPLSGFLAVIVFFTAILVAYLTKQFQNENLNYSSFNQMKKTNTKTKTIEKEKVVAETLNGRFAMLGSNCCYWSISNNRSNNSWFRLKTYYLINFQLI